MKSHHDHGNSVLKKLIEAGLHFRGLIYYHRSSKHGGMQADLVLEKDLRVLHLDLQASGRRTVSH